MPITPSPDHQAGSYPDTIRHVSNGDGANQTSFRNPSLDLEYRSEVLRLAHNTLEATVNSNYNTLEAFDKNHDHSGSNGEKIIDFAQVYANSNQTLASFSLATGATWTVKTSGGAQTLLLLKENGATNKDKIIFPGSVDIFDHVAAPASNLVVNPHSLKLRASTLLISSGCLIDGTVGGPYTEVTLDPTKLVGEKFAAPELSGKTSTTGTIEGIMVGDVTSPGSLKQNIILIRDSSNAPILAGSDPVYGLLVNTATPEAPVWVLHFFANGTPYSFATDTTIFLYGQEVKTLSNTPVVDPSFIYLAQKNRVV